MKNAMNGTRILVVGATGFLGMEVCRQLTAAGKNVSGLVRKSAAPEKVSALKEWGVKMVEGDLKDRASLKKALHGFEAVISTASSTFSRQDGDSIQTVDNEGQTNLVEEAINAGVRQYIYVSFPSMPFDFPLQDAKRKVEKKIKASQMSYTILQPTFFMDSWLSPAVGFDFPNAKAAIYGEGKNKISWIAIQDVAAFTAASVDNAEAKNKTIELGGPEALSPLEVVSIFEKASGKKFDLQHVPVAVLEGQKAAAPDDLGKSFSALMLTYAAGNEINMKETLKTFPVKMKSVQEHARQITPVSQPA